MTERLPSHHLAAHGAVLGAAMVLGVLAGFDPWLALATALGAAFVVVVLNDLTKGLCLMAFLVPLDGVPALSGGAISAPKIAGFLLGISWLATMATRRQRQLVDVRPVLAATLALFFAWQLLSLTWAEDADATAFSLSRYAPNLLLFPIAWTALRGDRDLRAVVLGLLAGVLVSAVLGVIGPADPAAGTDRATGLAGGANELAASMVVGIVLCAAFAARRRRSVLPRPAMIAGVALCALALFLSLSRGGLVALSGALLVAVLVAGRWRGRATVAALLVVLAGVGYFTAFAPLPARERVLQVGGGTGRTDLWTVAGRMIADRPVVGVGAGNFPVASIHYLLQPGAIENDEFIISVPKVAHNAFLEVLAESGIPGLALLLGIVGASLLGMLRAARIAERLGDRDMEILLRALFVATVGFLVAACFVSLNYAKLLWFLLALGPAAHMVAVRRSSSST